MTGKLAIDDDDIEPPAREAFGDERSGNPAADNQRIAFDVLSEVKTDSMPARREPGRTAAAQVGLFGIVCVKNADNKPQAMASGATADVSGARLRLIVLTKTMISGSELVASAQRPPQISAINLLMERNREARDEALILDFLFVDFRAGFVDHDHASTLVAVIKVNGDLTGDQVGGFLGVVLVFAIQSNRIFEPETVSDVEMKNGHWPPP